MQKYSASFLEVFLCLRRNRSLVWKLAQREIVGRYKGSLMGLAWSFLHPLLMLGVYTFVFGVVFKARWAGGADTNSEFALSVFSGLVTFGIFSECFCRAPELVVSNPTYVKKVVFPLEILPWVILTAALFHGMVGFLILLCACLLVNGVIPFEIWAMPLVLFPLLMLALGVGWLLSALGVYLRDVSQVVGVSSTVILFLSPIFYSARALPEDYRFLFFINPLTPIIEGVRGVLLDGTLPATEALIYSTVSGVAVAWLGFAVFQKARRGFADVL